MGSFFQSTAQARVNKKLDKYPILKLEQILDWKEIIKLLSKSKARQVDVSKRNRAYDCLKMFKAVLLGQWHSLSDPELEKSLSIRIDFILFCGFDDEEVPDETTLCRYRNWLVASGLMADLLSLVNRQLQHRGLQIKQADRAIVDATIIETAGGINKKNPIVDEQGQIEQPSPSKDIDARWVKKGPLFYLGYKLHAMTDEQGYFQTAHLTPANVHESKHLEPLLKQAHCGSRIFADKGYTSISNKNLLKDKKLKDGIMHKASTSKPLRASEKRFNALIKKTRYVVEQSFSILKCRFNFYRARYFSLERVQGQALFKMLCVNLLKASNRLRWTC